MKDSFQIPYIFEAYKCYSPLWPNSEVKVCLGFVQLGPTSLLEAGQLHVESYLKSCPINPLLAVSKPIIVCSEPFLLARLEINSLFHPEHI